MKSAKPKKMPFAPGKGKAPAGKKPMPPWLKGKAGGAESGMPAFKKGGKVKC